jgi:ABC-type lipoprotein release transport system permease subunit
MRFYLKMAWRNIFRNKKRTFLTGLIIAIGLASLMFTDAAIVGMKRNMIASVTSSFMGDAQIHRDGFQESLDTEKTIIGAGEIRNKLAEDPAVARFSRRVMGFGTVSSPADINSVAVYGIEPQRERPLSKLDETITQGAYLEGMGGIMIGSELAERLEAEVGDRIVVSVSNAESGNLAQELFRVSGIYTMQIEELDSSTAFIPLSTAQQLFGVGKGVHEIAVRFKETSYATAGAQEFKERYGKGENLAQTWPDLVPQMKRMLEMTDFSVGIVMIIVFAVIIFGIVNTLFMSLYERTFEFGVLRAVGTRSGRLKTMIVFEAGSLGIYSAAMGILLGALFIWLGSMTGMNLSGVELAGATFTDKIYTVFRARQFILHPLLILGFTILVSFYPARHAGKMSITDALQRTL